MRLPIRCGLRLKPVRRYACASLDLPPPAAPSSPRPVHRWKTIRSTAHPRFSMPCQPSGPPTRQSAAVRASSASSRVAPRRRTWHCWQRCSGGQGCTAAGTPAGATAAAVCRTACMPQQAVEVGPRPPTPPSLALHSACVVPRRKLALYSICKPARCCASAGAKPLFGRFGRGGGLCRSRLSLGCGYRREWEGGGHPHRRHTSPNQEAAGAAALKLCPAALRPRGLLCHTQTPPSSNRRRPPQAKNKE